MRRSFLMIACASLVVAGTVFSAAAQTKMPQMTFRERTLANGLRVLSVVDKSSPSVAIHVWYHVGSKDDPDQRSGFAHLFEHLMFKSTKNMKSEMMDRLTEDVGGWNNALTRDDVTDYYEVIPSNYLETLLWAEADRLASLTVDERTFARSARWCRRSIASGVLAPPYGQFFYASSKYHSASTRTSGRASAVSKIFTPPRWKTSSSSIRLITGPTMRR